MRAGKRWRGRTMFLIGLALVIFFIWMTAGIYPDKEKGLLFEIWKIEDQIDRIEEAINKNWFPQEDEQAVLLARRILNEKLAEAKIRYEYERKEKVKEIVKEIGKISFLSKTAP